MIATLAKNDKIFVAGHSGLVGGAVVRALKARGYGNVLTVRHRDLELTDQQAVRAFFVREKPAAVIMCAGRVGGIVANDSYPADFIADNLMIQTNTIDAAWRGGARKFVFMGTSCIYPREPARMPITEDLLLTGPLEQTNQWLAVAKIAGIKMCEAYRLQHGFDAVSIMPANLYGPGDYFDLEKAHVVPALMRKFHEAKLAGVKSVTVWGTGKPRREFLYVDDLAEATVFVLENYSAPDLVNIGTGEDIAIGDLARLVADIVGFSGNLEFDTSRPDGMARRILDSSKLDRLGWRASTSLKDGLCRTYHWFLENFKTARLS
jgi:GDP-L-fucose synthase